MTTENGHIGDPVFRAAPPAAGPACPVLCPACGVSPLSLPFSDKKGREYVKCLSCGLYLLLPPFRPDREAERRRYLLHDNSAENEKYLNYLNGIIDTAVSPFVRPGGSILDFGSGPGGAFVRLLEERGYRSRGYDPIFQPAPPDPGTRFDAATMIEVIEHVADPDAAMEFITAALGREGDLGTGKRPDRAGAGSSGRVPGGQQTPDRTSAGILVIKTLFAPAEEKDFLSWWYREDITHIIFYTLTALRELVGRFGFRLLWTDGKETAVFER